MRCALSSKRQLLIRRHFEAYRDLSWFEDLEPRFRERGIEGKELQTFREAWNEHAQIRDWDWWQKKTARTPSGRLEDEIMDITERLDQLGCLRWQQEQKQRNQAGLESYQQMLEEAINRAPANDKEKERGR